MIAQYTVHLGFAPVPNDASEEVEPFSTSRTRRSEVVMGSFSAVVPDTEDMGLFV